MRGREKKERQKENKKPSAFNQNQSLKGIIGFITTDEFYIFLTYHKKNVKFL